MKKIAFLAALALSSTSLVSHARTEIEVLREQNTLNQAKVTLLEARVAKVEAFLKAHPEFRSQLTVAAPATAAPAKSAPAGKTYTIRSGDTLSAISRRFNTTPDALVAHNNIKDARRINVGDKLIIPHSSLTSAVTTAIPVLATNQPLPKKATAAPTPKSASTYVVQKGDTYYGIARRHNMSMAKVVAANPSINAKSLRPGMVINLKAAPAAKTKTQRTSSTPKTQKKSTRPTTKTPKTKKATSQSSKKTSSKTVKTKRSTTKRSSMPEPKFESSSDAIQTIKTKRNMNYGQLAAKYGTSTKVLNELNGHKFTPSAQIAKGSEFYVPGH